MGSSGGWRRNGHAAIFEVNEIASTMQDDPSIAAIIDGEIANHRSRTPATSGWGSAQTAYGDQSAWRGGQQSWTPHPGPVPAVGAPVVMTQGVKPAWGNNINYGNNSR